MKLYIYGYLNRVQSSRRVELLRRVARDLAENRIVGWFQGRFEMGPRALGNRSILASPLRQEIRTRSIPASSTASPSARLRRQC